MASTNDIDTSEVDNLVDDLKKALDTSYTGAKAGYFANDRGKEPYDGENPPDLEDVALWNEFGTERIPARPFLRTAQNRATKRGEHIVQVRMEENSDVEQICKDLGLMLQDEIKNQITHGTFAPNAPSTIKRKGSSHPLIDTGNLRQSVHWGVTTSHGDKVME
jgi:hypothetical protein